MSIPYSARLNNLFVLGALTASIFFLILTIAHAADSSLCEPQPLYKDRANFNDMVCWSDLNCGGSAGAVICKDFEHGCVKMPGQADCGRTTEVPLSGPQASENIASLGDAVMNVFNLALLVSGILAFGAVVYGAFMYTFSAGNPGMQSDARDQITQAFLGLALLLGGYIILNTINPDLTRIQFAALPEVQAPKYDYNPSPGMGTCDPSNTAYASPDYLKSAGFGANAEKASRIANRESGGNPTAVSSIDACADGTKFSVGLFQINLVANSQAFCGKSGIFKVNSNGSPQGNCLEKDATKGYCIKWDCQLVATESARADFAKCVADAKDPAKNISFAVRLSGGGNNWAPWENSRKACGL